MFDCLGLKRAGSALISPDMPHMDKSICGDVIDYTADYNGWFKHYSKYLMLHRGREIPKPCMFKNKPLWRGGIEPVKGEISGNDKIWVSDMNCNLYLVPESRIVEPNTRQYEKYFKKHVEYGVYSIQYNHKTKTTKIVKKQPKKPRG